MSLLFKIRILTHLGLSSNMQSNYLSYFVQQPQEYVLRNLAPSLYLSACQDALLIVRQIRAKLQDFAIVGITYRRNVSSSTYG